MRTAILALLLGGAVGQAALDQHDRALAEQRAKIDAVDARIVALLNERAGIVREVGRIKRQTGAAVSDPKRVEDVLNRIASQNRGPLPNENLRRMYDGIIREMTAFEASEMSTRVVFETDLGAFTVEVDLAHAPVTAANFLKYVDAKFFDGGYANRAVRPDNTTRHDVEIQVIQFQVARARARDQLPPIPLERTSATGLAHTDGVISMAREGPDTARGSFFVAIGDQPALDFGGRRNADGQGFAAFGRVVSGMDVVRRIQQAHTGTSGAYGSETLDPTIGIVRAFRQ